MGIDASKINLSERDIEDWLYEHPSAVHSAWGPIKEWIGRQYHLPSGIADLIGVIDGDVLVVVEVKNVPINKAAITQVCRYAADVAEIVAWRTSYPDINHKGWMGIEKLIVGPSIDDQTFIEAMACDVSFLSFAIEINVDINRHVWNDKFRTMINEKCRELAKRPEWERYGEHVDIRDAKWEEEKRRRSHVDFALEDIVKVEADLVGNDIPEFVGDQRLVDVLASECPYPPDPSDMEWQVADESTEE